MITLIEALNYRCLRYVRQELDPFHILVGANSSGKSTFLDVVAFLGDLVSDGLDAAIRNRTDNFQDLVFGREGDRFELAVEARIPEEIRSKVRQPEDVPSVIRYQVGIESDAGRNELRIAAEQLSFRRAKHDASGSLANRFPRSLDAAGSILVPVAEDDPLTIIDRREGKSTSFSTESDSLDPADGTFRHLYLYHSGRESALNFVPIRFHTEDPDDSAGAEFPVATWFKDFLSQGVRYYSIDSERLRAKSSRGDGLQLGNNGANLPFAVDDFARKHPKQYKDWLAHLRTALPDLKSIKTSERPDTKQRWLVLEYSNGLKVPSWMVSDGTLRLIALTLLAYLPDFKGIYLIEEPENGVHPLAIETIYQSLSSAYDAQVLLATHSPILLSIAEPEQVLCFAKTEEGATDIVRGDLHPRLRNWKRETDLGTLFASGVMG
jgi:predicted ATPase